MKQRVFLSIIAAMMCIVFTVPSYAAEVPKTAEEEEGAYSEEYIAVRRNSVVSTCSASLSISGSTATCGASGTAYSSMASSVSLTMYLQKYSSGSWTSISSWSTTKSGTVAVLSSTKTIGTGTYRVKVVCTAGGESVTVYSGTKTK